MDINYIVALGFALEMAVIIFLAVMLKLKTNELEERCNAIDSYTYRIARQIVRNNVSIASMKDAMNLTSEALYEVRNAVLAMEPTVFAVYVGEEKEEKPQKKDKEAKKNAKGKD